DALFLNHMAGGVALDGLDLGAFLPDRAVFRAGVALAVAVHIGAANAAGHGVRNLLLAHLGHHPLDGVRHLLLDDGTALEVAAGAVTFIGVALLIHESSPAHARDRVGDLLDNVIGFLVANLVWNLGVDRPLAIGRARNLF